MKHYSKLPPVSGPYERIPDRGTPGRVVRMVRCLVDGAEIPSLGIAYHERGTRHQVASEGRRLGELIQSQRRTRGQVSERYVFGPTFFVRKAGPGSGSIGPAEAIRALERGGISAEEWNGRAGQGIEFVRVGGELVARRGES